MQTLDQEKQSRILTEAKSLFLHYGYKKTTIEDIAKAANIAKGTIYVYFKSKAEILLRLGVEYLIESRKALNLELEKIIDPNEKLKKILIFRAEIIFDFVEEHPHALEVISACTPEEGERQGALIFFQEFEVLVEGVLKQGIALKYFKDTIDAGTMAHHIFYMSQVFQPPYKSTRTKSELLLMVKQYADTLALALAR